MTLPSSSPRSRAGVAETSLSATRSQPLPAAATGAISEPARPEAEASSAPPPPPAAAPLSTAATRETDPTMACPFGLCGARYGARRTGLPALSRAVGKGTLSMNLYADVGYAFGPQRKHRYVDYITGEEVEDVGRRDYTSYPLYVNQFALAYAYVQGQYEIPEKLRLRLALHTGHIVESLYYEEKKSLQLIREVALYYYFIPQLAVEAGIFPSYYGAEIVLNKENLHATRAYIADFTPDYEAGARIHVHFRKDMTLRFMVLNGWQEIRDQNGRKAYGFVFSVNRPGQIVGDWNMYWGNEAGAGQKAVFRHYQNLYYRIWLGKRWLVFPMLDLVVQKNNTTDRYNVVVSPALSLRYGITDRVGVALRYDYLYDKADIVPELRTGTPNGWQSHSGTATLEYLPLPQLTFRVEGRYGVNKDAVFRNSTNTLVRDDWYVILSGAFHI
ncbi:MAG: outer membrane beta-barrel protein [Myxococcales bacterium]|nr:outer membrane beta-barrel protein [Myxococcales bacterium]